MYRLLVLTAFIVLPVALAACASEDPAPSVVVDRMPEAIAVDSAVVFDEDQTDPVETATPPPIVADAPPSAPTVATPAAPARTVEAVPTATPETTHTMDGGMTMDGHAMEEEKPMDHSPMDHSQMDHPIEDGNQ